MNYFDYLNEALKKQKTKNKALDEFLDQSTIIPPGEWDTSIRLNPPLKVPSKEERIILKMIKVKKDKPRTESHEDNPGLQFTGRFRKLCLLAYYLCLISTFHIRFCGGLIEDIRRKIPYYVSDFKDAFNLQCVAAIAFLYFACLSPIIVFGDLLSFATDKNMV